MKALLKNAIPTGRNESTRPAGRSHAGSQFAESKQVFPELVSGEREIHSGSIHQNTSFLRTLRISTQSRVPGPHDTRDNIQSPERGTQPHRRSYNPFFGRSRISSTDRACGEHCNLPAPCVQAPITTRTALRKPSAFFINITWTRSRFLPARLNLRAPSPTIAKL